MRRKDKAPEGRDNSDKRITVVEAWLHTEGVARYDAYHRAPSGSPAAEVLARLERIHRQRRQGGNTDFVG